MQSNDSDKGSFDADLIRKYPKANRKIGIEVMPFGLTGQIGDDAKNQSVYISPYGIEFQGKANYTEGTLLKINVALPTIGTVSNASLITDELTDQIPSAF